MGKISQTGGIAALRWGWLIAVLLVCWSGAGHAQTGLASKRTDDFINHCSTNGLFTKVSGEPTCSFMIGIQASLTASLGRGRPGNTGCESLASKIDLSKDADPGAQIAQPVFQWLRANPGKLSNDIYDDIEAAIWALYRCK